MARGTLRRLAALLLLCLASGPAAAQDCAQRCITIQQFMGEERTAAIPLTCDSGAIECRGDGNLLVGGMPAPVAISATYGLSAVDVHFHMPYTLADGRRTQSFTMPLDGGESQAKNIALRWSSANERPHVTRYLPGHIRIVIERYRPRPDGAKLPPA